MQICEFASQYKFFGMKKIYLFANWKMYLDVAESKKLAAAYASERANFPRDSVVAIFPSALSFSTVGEAITGTTFALGAQNTFWIDKGGYTGEVSAVMFKNVGGKYALVGHAERRHLFSESNHEVRQKIDTMLTAPLTPVLCVGETLQEKKDGKTMEVLEAQLRAAYMDIAWPKNIEAIIAYEPVWAVGSGEACEPEEAEKIAGLIHDWATKLLPKGISPVVLYGGSVREENILDYINQPHLAGVLVGGASTKLSSLLGLLGQLK